MKRLVKICGILALICICIGSGFVAYAASQNQPDVIAQAVERATRGHITAHLSSWNDWSFTSKNKGNSGKSEVLELAESVKNIDIQVGGCEFEIKDSGNNTFYCETKNIDLFGTAVDDNTIQIKGDPKINKMHKDAKVTVYLPLGREYEEIKVELGAGEFTCYDLKADKAQVTIGAGELSCYDSIIKDFDIDVNAGEAKLERVLVDILKANVNAGQLVFAGDCKEDIDVECNTGNMELTLDGSEEDYDLDLECTMGNLTVGGKNYTGISSHHEENHHDKENHHNQNDHHADKKIKAKCSLGNIEIEFD